jgi:hypothetical protein
VSILHIELFHNWGDEGLLAKTNAGDGAGAGAGTDFLTVDVDAKELACLAEIGDLIFFGESGLDFNPSFGSHSWVQHRDVVNVQKYQNTIAAEIEVGVGQGLCEFEREQEGVNIVVPKSW